jgi:hypothetical protein
MRVTSLFMHVCMYVSNSNSIDLSYCDSFIKSVFHADEIGLEFCTRIIGHLCIHTFYMYLQRYLLLFFSMYVCYKSVKL